MSTALAALEAALGQCQPDGNAAGTKEYDEALQCMDERLALIDSLVQLARVEPMQRQPAATLAAARY